MQLCPADVQDGAALHTCVFASHSELQQSEFEAQDVPMSAQQNLLMHKSPLQHVLDEQSCRFAEQLGGRGAIIPPVGMPTALPMSFPVVE